MSNVWDAYKPEKAQNYRAGRNLKNLKQTMYPADKTALWGSGLAAQYTYQEASHVREYFKQMAQKNNQQLGSMFSGSRIGDPSDYNKNNRVTSQILKDDPMDMLGAIPGNSAALQTMHRLLTEAGSGGWASSLLSNAQTGIVSSIENLLMSGISGGGFGNILSQFTSMFQTSQNQAQNQTNAQANSQWIDAGTDITQNPQNSQAQV